jgi:uncharacterized OsmC-like protein
MTAAALPVDPGDGEVVTVHGSESGHAGPFVISAGRNHFVSDTRAAIGGPGEAVTAGELLLSALASCALGLVQRHAAALGVPLSGGSIVASYKRDTEDPTRYAYIQLSFHLAGIDREAGWALIKHSADRCPIYNTLRRGGQVEFELAGCAHPAERSVEI